VPDLTIGVVFVDWSTQFAQDYLALYVFMVVIVMAIVDVVKASVV